MPRSGSESPSRRPLLHPRSLDDLDDGLEHLALHRTFAFGRGNGRVPDLLDDVHALNDMTERREACGIPLRVTRIETRDVRNQDEEIRACCARTGVCHGNGARDIVKPGLSRRLVRDRWIKLPDIGANAALDQVARVAVHRPVKRLAVETVRIDI